jgi:hypothetical protein
LVAVFANWEAKRGILVPSHLLSVGKIRAIGPLPVGGCLKSSGVSANGRVTSLFPRAIPVDKELTWSLEFALLTLSISMFRSSAVIVSTDFWSSASDSGRRTSKLLPITGRSGV